MITYQIENPTQFQSKPKSVAARLKSRYLDYCESQKNMKIYWYMKAIILLTCVYMVPSITIMAMATEYYIYYVGLSMALFFTNVLAHITGLSSKYYVPIYHGTTLLMIIVPLVTLILGTNGTIPIL